MSKKNYKKTSDEIRDIFDGFNKVATGHEVRKVMNALSLFVVSMVEEKEESTMLLNFMLRDIQKDAKRYHYLYNTNKQKFNQK